MVKVHVALFGASFKRKLKQSIKKFLISHPPFQYSERTDAFFRLSLLKKWVNTYKPFVSFSYREELFKYVEQELIKNQPVFYLEFGVYKGASLQFWSSLNTNQESEFMGFDSFEGLGENWVNISSTVGKGRFSTGGMIPENNDLRVKFIKGWFQNTLPDFLEQYKSGKQVIIHCDADLYSSTMYALCKLDGIIIPGTILFFDDFSSALHDFRALHDYTKSFQRQYKVIGTAGPNKCEKVAIQVLT